MMISDVFFVQINVVFMVYEMFSVVYGCEEKLMSVGVCQNGGVQVNGCDVMGKGVKIVFVDVKGNSFKVKKYKVDLVCVNEVCWW